MMYPVETEKEYLRLRNTKRQQQLVARARLGDATAKQNLLQTNYSCLPDAEGRLKGSRRCSTSVGMDIDLDRTAEDYEERMKEVVEKVLGKREELGLLMLERSATKGYHMVFRRHEELSQEENLRWASELLGVPFDEGAKDVTRVFYTTTASEEDLLFVSDELFELKEAPWVEENEVHTPPYGHPSEEGTLTHDAASPSNSQFSIPDSQLEYEEEYDGVPYRLIVESLCELLGGEPAHGSRNSFIFSMAAHLRYVCNDDAHWIARVLPTYGEGEQKWWRTIQSACQRSQNRGMPTLVKRALTLARQKCKSEMAEVENMGGEQPPEMPAKLPKLIRHLVKNVPEVCQPAVANAVFPALGIHLNNVCFELLDGTEKEATFMCVTMAPQSSGKASVNKPIEYIVADIVKRDEVNRQREQEWKDASSNRGANKEKPQRPSDLCVQVLVSDMTNAAFVQRMKDANGRYLYTNLEELDLLKQLQTNGTKDIGKIICLCFDNGKYGQERVGCQSVTGRVALRWNWNASSTIQKGVHFFRGRMVDGTLSRVNICTIIPDKSKPFVYGHYDEHYAEELAPFIANLNLAQGKVECRPALVLAKKLLEKCQDIGALTEDDVYKDMSYRAVTIAYMKAMVLYIASGMSWDKSIADFMEWSLMYDLWCKSHFFGQEVMAENEKEAQVGHRGRRNMLDLLPKRFTLKEAEEVRREQGMNGGGRSMLAMWVYRGYVVYDEPQGVYVKTEQYLKRKAGHADAR